MNIRVVSKNIYNSVSGGNIKRRMFEMLPDFTIKNPKMWANLGTKIGRPDVNRGIMGATALLTQPFIDYNNRKVDKNTAEVSTCRTIGKILAGTTVGMGVRAACYYLIKGCTSIDPNASSWKRRLMPSQKIEKIISKRNMDWFKNYKNTLANLLGLAAMLVTNVALDVPLTNFVSKKLIALRGKNPQEVQSTSGQKTAKLAANDNPERKVSS